MVTLWKNGQRQRATCFATLLQEELICDVARFFLFFLFFLIQLGTGLKEIRKVPSKKFLAKGKFELQHVPLGGTLNCFKFLKYFQYCLII